MSQNILIAKIIPTIVTPFICMKGCYSFVLDNSSSMNSPATVTSTDGDKINHGWSQLDIAKHAISTFISALSSDDWVAIHTYSDKAKLVINWTCCDLVGKETIINALMTIQSSGCTNILAGIEAGIMSFYNIGINDQEYNMTMIFTTDGIPSQEYHPPK